MRTTLLSIIAFTTILLTSCGGDAVSNTAANDENSYPEGHEYPIKAKALNERMTLFANNLPHPDSIESMYLNSFSEKDFLIEDNSMDLFLFDPQFVAQFGEDPNKVVVGEEHFQSGEDQIWGITQGTTVNQTANIKVIESFENLDSRQHHEIHELVQAEKEFEKKGNFAVVYRLAEIKAGTDSDSTFKSGFLAADIVVFSRADMKPIAAFPVMVTNDKNIEYSYFEGESQKDAAESAVETNLNVSFYNSIENNLAQKIKMPEGTPEYIKFRVHIK